MSACWLFRCFLVSSTTRHILTCLTRNITHLTKRILYRHKLKTAQTFIKWLYRVKMTAQCSHTNSRTLALACLHHLSPSVFEPTGGYDNPSVQVRPLPPAEKFGNKQTALVLRTVSSFPFIDYIIEFQLTYWYFTRLPLPLSLSQTHARTGAHTAISAVLH